jgi:cell division septation protein DedD
MAFWDKVRDELKSAAKEGWSALKEGARFASEKGEEVAKTGKLKYKSYNTHKDAEKLFTELGGIVYDLSKSPSDNPLANADVKRLVQEIKKTEDEIAGIEGEIEKVKEKVAAATPTNVPSATAAKAKPAVPKTTARAKSKAKPKVKPVAETKSPKE